MIAQCALKAVTLVNDVQSTLVWSGAEFGITLGQDNTVIKRNVSIAFQVQNNTSQVVYIGLRYETRQMSYNLSQSTAIAAVKANQSVFIDYKSVPALSNIGPDLVSITMTLLSAASGSVLVSLGFDAPIMGIGGGDNALIGPSNRLIADYIPYNSFQGFTIAAGAIIIGTALYTTPAGKRGHVRQINMYIDPIGSFPSVAGISLRLLNSGTIYTLANLTDARNQIIVATDFWIESGDQLLYDSSNGGGSAVLGFVSAYIEETF